MKAIGICGSPRKGGNTEALVQRCLARLEQAGIETEFVHLGEKTVKPCLGCATCRETQDLTCAIKDDDFHPIFDAMLEAKIIVVGSPVYYGSATPQTMALLDRAGYVSGADGRRLSRKIGGPIVVARRAGQNFTYAQLVYWYTINDMIVAGSTYWNIAFGREPGQVLEDEEGLRTVDRFADNLIWLAGKL
ncbi:MAG: flavodoxin family protein [Anaerolineae bacterium]|nr:flavodoxin family protein [Anaerolineae bacterium]